MSVGKEVEKLDRVYILDGTVNCYGPSGKHCGSSLKY
jgi:hypothetical protein